MKKQIITIAYLILFMAITVSAVFAENLDEATLRSGSVLAEHDIPPVLVAGQTYRFSWTTQSYVPLRSWLQMKLPDGSTDMIEATLDRVEEGSYYISDRHSMNYHFHVNYTVPNSTGKVRVGFYHAQDDGKSPLKMYGLLPTGVVDRPYGTAGKQFYRNICDQNSYGGQCVEYVRNYFGGSYDQMPSLCSHSDCGAYHAYDDWNLGFGKGKIPKINSIMVIDRQNGLSVGHVAVVVAMRDNQDGTWTLTVQESNWDLDELVDCATQYTFDANTLKVRRGSGNWLNLRGFVYSNAP